MMIWILNEYRKHLTSSDTRKIAVIILKLEQYRFTTEQWVEMMLSE